MSALFEWLVKASTCGDPEVERAAEIMKDYYQGVSPAELAAYIREQDARARGERPEVIKIYEEIYETMDKQVFKVTKTLTAEDRERLEVKKRLAHRKWLTEIND